MFSLQQDSESRGRSPGRTTAADYAAVLGYGFRPFFLLAGVHAMLAIPVWMAMRQGMEPILTHLPPHVWHAHEMLYGFIVAAMTGFLLTAVPSWTGQRGFAGAPLLGLAALWLVGRVAITFNLGLEPMWIATIDLAFIPTLALTILPSLIRSGNRRNLVFIALLGVLFGANLHFHLDGAVGTGPLLLGLNAMFFMVTLVGGRVIPTFTSSGLKQVGIDARIKRHPLLDKAIPPAAGGVLAVDLLVPGSWIAGALAVITALLLLMQLARWQGYRALGEPIVWVLHAGFLWLPICLALKAAWIFGAPIPATSWLHALTAGALATMILGIMSRAALGHTGRPLVPSAGMVAGYFLLTTAALSRVFGPILFPQATMTWWIGSAALWTLAFTLFVIIYAPILCRPRADGRPG